MKTINRTVRMGIFGTVLCAALCGYSATNQPPATPAAKPTENNVKQETTNAPVAVVETSMGTFKIAFLTDKAPKTCENFITLAKKGFYDGLGFHRVIPGFMIQGGCPKGDGTGGPGYMIKAEFNDTKHVPGIVSMARANDPDSAGSQFFVCVASPSHLDGQYTAFGKVTEGYDVVEKIAKVPCNGSTPVTKVTIKKITVE